MQKLTDDQRRRWATDGYLHLEGVLSTGDVERYCAEVDRVRGLPGYDPIDVVGHYGWVQHTRDPDPQGFMDRRRLIEYGQAFIELIDRSPVFDLIVGLMGPFVLLSMSEAIVRTSNKDFPGYTHIDGGAALRDIRVTATSRPLAVKAMYLLTDVGGTDSGNLTVFPGSHLRPFPDTPESQPTPRSPGATQLTGKAGDCYLFPYSLWHGPAPNHSGQARKTLLYNYCQLFLRCYDYHSTPDILEQCTPRQRRLLGDLGHEFRPGDFFHAPQDQAAVISGNGNQIGGNKWA